MLYIFFYSFNFSWVPGINRVKMPMFNRTFNCKVPFSLLKRVNSTPHSPPLPQMSDSFQMEKYQFPPLEGGIHTINTGYIINHLEGFWNYLIHKPLLRDCDFTGLEMGLDTGVCFLFLFFLNKLFGWFYSREGKPLTKDTPATGSNGSSEREK